MYAHFHKLGKTCAIVFTNNRLNIRKLGTRRTNFWVGHAKCKRVNCVRVKFVIKEKPGSFEDVPVIVIVTGICTHTSNSKEEIFNSVEISDTSLS